MKRLSRGRAPYGIVGNGKASRHLQAYFKLLKIPHVVWHRGSGRPLPAVIGNCRKIFVLIKDSQLENFIRSNPFLKNRVLLHFSGSVELPGVFSLHPFMPLSGRRLALAEYRSIPFALDSGSPSLRDLVPEFKNPCFRVKKGKKPLYHALCVLGGNFPFILWRKALTGLRGEFGIPAKHIRAYFRALLANFESDPESGLSGPLQRKDVKTMKANLKALKGDPFRRVYAAFARAYVGDKDQGTVC